MKFDRRELAGAVADIGVLVPIAVALIVGNGLSATAVLLPAGLLYVTAALVYRLPIPVQPLKAFGAIAIAKGLGSDEIAAGALLMGVVFIALGRLGVLDLASRGFPRALIRGVQLTVGLLFLEIAWRLLTDPPTAFVEHALDPSVGVALGVIVVGLALALKQQSISLAFVGAGALTMAVLEGDQLDFGPSTLEVPALDGATFLTALTVLVVPQLPLSFANSCLATADAARSYFGHAAQRVQPGRLATTFGSANLIAGSIGGMPVCHGAGGLTAHYAFGARTGGAPLVMGMVLVGLAVSLGAGLAPLLAAFPLPLLAGLLASAGILHIGLLRDLRGTYDWAVALGVGAVGFQLNLTIALMLGLAAWWLPRAARALRARPAFGA